MEETRKPARKKRAAPMPKPTAAKSTARPRSATSAGRSSGQRTRAVAPAPADREEMIRTAAYFRAERRGFAPGYEWEDWLAAESEVGAAPKAPKSAPRKSATRKSKTR